MMQRASACTQLCTMKAPLSPEHYKTLPRSAVQDVEYRFRGFGARQLSDRLPVGYAAVQS